MAQYGVVEDPVQAQRKKILQEQLSHAWNSQVRLPPRPPTLFARPLLRCYLRGAVFLPLPLPTVHITFLGQKAHSTVCIEISRRAQWREMEKTTDFRNHNLPVRFTQPPGYPLLYCNGNNAQHAVVRAYSTQ